MKPHTITIKLRDGTVIRGHVITDDAARVLRVFRDCADVVEADSARGEPVAWMNPYGGTLQVRITGLEYEKYTIPLYTAPLAPTVDVNAISDEALNAAWSYIIFNAENEQTEAVYDMRAALRAIFNKGE